MNTAIIIHTTAILTAFFISFFIFYKPKGTALHKAMGRVFVISMLIGATSSFWIKSNGNFSYIHILSVLTIYWLSKAIWVILFKPKNWLYIHASNMGSAYIGILIAGTGVIVRHYIFPGNKTYWIYASLAVVAIAIPIMVKSTLKFRNKNI